MGGTWRNYNSGTCNTCVYLYNYINIRYQYGIYLYMYISWEEQYETVLDGIMSPMYHYQTMQSITIHIQQIQR